MAQPAYSYAAVTEALCTLGQAAWRSERVGHRTGRVEPR